MTSEERKEYMKIYRQKNKDKINEKKREYNSKNKKELTEHRVNYLKEYRINNELKLKNKAKEYRERTKEKRDEWVKNNKEKLKEYYREYKKKKRNNDALYKLKCNIQNLIYYRLKTNDVIKDKRTEQILGCTIEEFKLHLESKFESWMNWDNYGLYNGEYNYGWDIDHIIPMVKATNKGEVIEFNHFTNLQPLCSKVNRDIKRGN
jgi:hypothetical protein